jgi:hypothetical protein
VERPLADKRAACKRKHQDETMPMPAHLGLACDGP